jgi:hypothetical protein
MLNLILERMRTEYGGGAPQSASFSQALSTLKREGSNMLVVGTDCVDAHVSACDRLLGDDEPDRRRLFVIVDRDDTRPCGHRPTDETESYSRVVARNLEGELSIELDLPTTTVETRLLSTLGSEINAVIDEFDREAGGLEPAEFRLCFDSLGPLFQRHDSQTLFRLLHIVTARVRQVNGMGHFHLEVDHDSQHVRLLEPLFDAVVEVRRTETGRQQRWHIRDKGLESDWLDI